MAVPQFELVCELVVVDLITRIFINVLHQGVEFLLLC